MLLPMLGGCFVAMLVPTLLRDVPIYDALREHTIRREHAAHNAGSKLLMLNVPNDGLAPLVYMDVLDPHELRATISDTS